MISNRDIELIQSYQNNSNDMVEKEILSHVLEEMNYRVPIERHIGSKCPVCNAYIDSSADQFCRHCGQAIE